MYMVFIVYISPFFRDVDDPEEMSRLLLSPHLSPDLHCLGNTQTHT